MSYESRPVRIVLPLDELGRLYADGATIRDLAARYQCSYGKVRKDLIKAGVVLRARANWTTNRDKSTEEVQGS